MKHLDITLEKLNSVMTQINLFSESDNRAELKLENINSSNDRRQIYQHSQKLGLSAESYFYENSQNKYMIIKKSQLVSSYNPNKITSDFINFFVKYTEIPFPTTHPDHFDYFVELLDPYYNTKNKLNILYDDLKSLDENNELKIQNIVKYKKLLWNVKEEIKSYINSNDEYKNFFETSKLEINNLPQIINNKSVYSNENINKTLLSIDVKSANFRVLKYFCPNLLSKFDEWNDFIDIFIKNKSNKFNFLKESKPFRTILINEMNNGVFNKFAIIFINDILQSLKLLNYYENLIIVSCQNDEIVFEIKSDFVEEFMFDKFDEFVNLVNRIHNFTKIKLFKLKKIYNDYNYFVCESVQNNFIGFKNIPRTHIAQVIKIYQGEKINELDLKYTNETGNILQNQIIT